MRYTNDTKGDPRSSQRKRGITPAPSRVVSAFRAAGPAHNVIRDSIGGANDFGTGIVQTVRCNAGRRGARRRGATGVVTGFLGPNGAGKSTTMRLMLGLDAPDAGEVRIGGQRDRELCRPV